MDVPGRMSKYASDGMPDRMSEYTYIHNIYMVVDLKVLVRSFNCESRACYVGNPRESFFSSSRK